MNLACCSVLALGKLYKMKKIFILITIVMALTSATFAQSKKKGTEAPKQTTGTTKTDDSRKMKKDGTPDKRYKENKEATKNVPSGPVRKDGQPDKRYKANKVDAGKEKK